MDGDDDLPLHLLRQCAQERRELSDVDLVHALDWVVNHEPRQLRLHREVQREEERECGRVEIARAQHRARISAFAATTVMGLERSEEHTSELQSLMRISYAVFC